ncbi:MAG: glycosyltransferase [Psychrosphaera sp.]|nr:glycosyltransferase [Psychrosphaera sp.]
MHDKISLIIPTYNSMAQLRTTLDALLWQTLAKNRYEIIVVDDGSSDDTQKLVEQYQSQLDIGYFYLEDLGFRLAAARNVGIKAAKYPLTLIFDCGMLASPTLLQQHIAALAKQPKQVIVGLSYGVEEFSMDNAKALAEVLNQHNIGGDDHNSNNFSELFSTLKTQSRFYDCRYGACDAVGFDLDLSAAPWVICWGGHFSCETAVLRQLGGFDEWFNSWGGEDVDLAIRLSQFGCRFSALTSHQALHMPHFRCEHSNKASAQINIDYIINKNKLDGVDWLAQHDWQTIFSASLEQLTTTDKAVVSQ